MDREPRLRGAPNAALLLRPDHLERIAEALAGLRLHLAEDQPLSAANDEVELIAPPAGVRGQDPVPT